MAGIHRMCWPPICFHKYQNDTSGLDVHFTLLLLSTLLDIPLTSFSYVARKVLVVCASPDEKLPVEPEKTFFGDMLEDKSSRNDNDYLGEAFSQLIIPPILLFLDVLTLCLHIAHVATVISITIAFIITVTITLIHINININIKTEAGTGT